MKLLFMLRPKGHATYFSLKSRKCNMIHVIEWIDHDIVVGLCSEVPIRLSYYIHMVKSFCFTWGSNWGPSHYKPSTLPLDQILSYFRAILSSCVISFFIKTLSILVNFLLHKNVVPESLKSSSCYTWFTKLIPPGI